MKYLKEASPLLIGYRDQRCQYHLDRCVKDKLLPIGASIEDSLLCGYPRDSEFLDEMKLLDKLLSDQRMINVWKTLSKNLVDHFQFYRAISAGLVNSRQKENSMAPGERDNWLENIAVAAKKLSNLIEGSKYDGILQRKHIECFESNKAVMESVANYDGVESIKEYDMKEFRTLWEAFGTTSLSSALDDLVDVSSQPGGGLDTKFLLKRPKTEKAGRKLFIAELTGFLIESAKQPLRRVVADTVSVVFEIEEFTEKDVRDALKGVVIS